MRSLTPQLGIQDLDSSGRAPVALITLPLAALVRVSELSGIPTTHKRLKPK
jgi:hypothetical protein